MAVVVGPRSSTVFRDTTSFEFDGTDDRFVSQSSFQSLDGESYVGISFWVKIPNVSLTNETILRIDNSVAGYSFLLFIRTTGVIDVSFPGGSSFTRSSTGAITSNNWHHVYVRFDGSISSRYDRLRVFVDGSLNHGSSNFFPIVNFPNNSSTMYLANNGSTSYANCYINELAFYTSGDDTLPNEIWNNGSANNLDENTYTPIVWYRSENATWDGLEWTMTDEKSTGPDLVSNNTVAPNRVHDVP